MRVKEGVSFDRWLLTAYRIGTGTIFASREQWMDGPVPCDPEGEQRDRGGEACE